MNEELKAYREAQLNFLDSEVKENGDYQSWYEDLALFRKYIKDKYIRFKTGKEFYIYKSHKNQYGDYIDHHIISYLAPFDFTRLGFGGERLTPVQQVKKLSDYIEVGGVNLYM